MATSQSPNAFEEFIILCMGMVLLLLITSTLWILRRAYISYGRRFMHWCRALIDYYVVRVFSPWKNSLVYITEDEPLYDQLLRFVAHQWPHTQDSRVAVATTRVPVGSKGEEDMVQEYTDVRDPLRYDPDQVIPYLSAADRVTIDMKFFDSSFSIHYLGYSITIKHCPPVPGKASVKQETGVIRVSCYGGTLTPIWMLLDDAQKHASELSRASTFVYRAVTQPHANTLGWRKIRRRAQDIRSVIMGKQAKFEIFDDMNDFLSHRTMHWSAERGIPYRRRYLFTGLSGTGKTSLALGLAAVFGLSIFTLSFLDPLLTETRFKSLMSSLPPRCIVLLENVEEVGMKRHMIRVSRTRSRGPSTEPKKKPPARKTRAQADKGQSDKEQNAKADTAMTDSEKPKVRRGRDSNAGEPAILLSVFLDALHGVAAHEGHVVIMTTKHPENFDRGLTRLTRVHKQVHFKLARAPELRAMFVNIFRDLNDPASRPRMVLGSQNPVPRNNARIEDLINIEAGPELSASANKFATSVPEGKLSLAEVQSFLLQYKDSPRLACEKAHGWASYAIVQNEAKERAKAALKRLERAKKQQPPVEVEDGSEDEEKDEEEDGNGNGDEDGDGDGDVVEI